MTATNSSSVYAQRSEYNSGQGAQSEVGCVIVTDTCYCLNRSLSFISIQASGCLVLEFGSNEHPPAGVDSAVPHSTNMNHVGALSLTRFSSTMGYDDPAYLATVSVRFTIDPYAHIVDGVFFSLKDAGPPGGYPVNQSQRQLDGYSTPGITQPISFPPGLQVGGPRFGYHYAPTISVSFLPPPSLRVHMAFLNAPLTVGGAH
jgi:hypothetical protein